VTFYVCPDGNDAWSGRLERPVADRTDGPLASLHGARDAVRKLKAQGPLSEPVRIRVAAGTYAMTSTLVLTPLDSGTTDCPVVYEAALDSKPLFTGGRSITGWQQAEGGLWTAHVPQVAAGEWYFEQLWVNGSRATRARSPNSFYYHVLGAVEHGIDPDTGKPANLAGRTFRAREADIKPLLDVPQEGLTDVTLIAYHSWETSRCRIAHVEAGNPTVHVTARIPWGFDRWGPNMRYHLENFKAALDEPAPRHARAPGLPLTMRMVWLGKLSWHALPVRITRVVARWFLPWGYRQLLGSPDGRADEDPHGRVDACAGGRAVSCR